MHWAEKHHASMKCNGRSYVVVRTTMAGVIIWGGKIAGGVGQAHVHSDI